MYRCILINRWWLADSLLEKYIRRTRCLNLTWVGAYSDEALQMLQSDEYDLIFACLPPPDQPVTDLILSELRRKQGSLIITSSYPEYLFKEYDLKPISFLKEPFPMIRLKMTLDKYTLTDGKEHE